MRRAAALACFLVGLLLAGAPPAIAQDAAPPKSSSSSSGSSGDDDVFQTSWFGLRPEFWYSPSMSLQAKVGGTQGNGSLGSIGGVPIPGTTSLIPTRFDAQKDLGVTTNTPTLSYQPSIPGTFGLEAFVDTRWVSVSLWGVMPFTYTGHQVLTQQITFDGFTFSVSRPVDTTLEQFLGGLDMKVNIINNRFIRLSPVVAVRMLGINWNITDVGTPPITGAKISTADANLPITFNRFQVIPYPEIGGEVRAGYRDVVEADLKLTGMYVSVGGYEARTFLVDGGVTGYIPVFPYVGVRVGYRYYYFDAQTTDTKGTHSFDAQLRLSGFTGSVIVRF